MARARQRLRKASLASHLRGLWLRRRLTRAGIVVVAPGRPGVRVVNHGTITVANVAFFPGVRLECWAGAHLSIGTGTYLNRNTEVIAAKEVRIGCGCLIGWDVVIMDTDQHGMAGAAQHVEDAVEDPAHVDGPWPPTGLRWREQGGENGPLPVAQVRAGVGQGGCGRSRHGTPPSAGQGISLLRYPIRPFTTFAVSPHLM